MYWIRERYVITKLHKDEANDSYLKLRYGNEWADIENTYFEIIIWGGNNNERRWPNEKMLNDIMEMDNYEVHKNTPCYSPTRSKNPNFMKWRVNMSKEKWKKMD